MYPKISRLKTPLVLSVFTLLIFGCSTTKYIKPAESFSHNGKARLVTKSNDNIKVLSVTKLGDSLMFSGSESLRDYSFIPLTNVKNITVTKRGKGALQGAGLGFLTGFSIIFVSLNGCKKDFLCGDPVAAAMAGIVAGIFPGAPIGAIFGTITGKRTYYVFEESSLPDPSKTITKPQRGVHHRRIKR